MVRLKIQSMNSSFRSSFSQISHFRFANYLLFVLLCIFSIVTQISIAQTYEGICILESTSSGREVSGNLILTTSGGVSQIKGELIRGLVSGKHAIHVHKFGFTHRPSGLGTGDHYDSNSNNKHGLPPNTDRHLGDMGSIVFPGEEGTYDKEIVTDFLKTSTGGDVLWDLSDPNKNIIGHSIIIHELEDKGTGDTGDAGRRNAQCVIGIRNKLANAAKNSNPVYKKAACSFKGYNKWKEVGGIATFEQVGTSVRVKVRVCQLPDGFHGINIHEFGDLSENVDLGPRNYPNVGNHYDPKGTNQHALPSEEIAHHAGDLGGIFSSGGAAEFDKTLDTISLDGTDSIIGRSIIIHSEPDQGLSYQPNGYPIGNGEPIAACVIGVVENFEDLSIDKLDSVCFAKGPNLFGVVVGVAIPSVIILVVAGIFLLLL